MRLIWAEKAVADLQDIADHYAQFDPDLPDELLERIYAAPLILLERPRIGAPIGSYDLRKWLVSGSPFLLLYRIGDDRIEIARVLHGATDWKSP